MATEERTARLTILIDPRKKEILERLCAEADTTPSQVVRQLIRDFISDRLGSPWTPADLKTKGGSSPRNSRNRR